MCVCVCVVVRPPLVSQNPKVLTLDVFAFACKSIDFTCGDTGGCRL